MPQPKYGELLELCAVIQGDGTNIGQALVWLVAEFSEVTFESSSSGAGALVGGDEESSTGVGLDTLTRRQTSVRWADSSTIRVLSPDVRDAEGLLWANRMLVASYGGGHKKNTEIDTTATLLKLGTAPRVLGQFWDIQSALQGVSLNTLSPQSAAAAAAAATVSLGQPQPLVSRYISDFQELSRLGKGGFGVVVAAINSEAGWA
eukprot:gene1602-32991_t